MRYCSDEAASRAWSASGMWSDTASARLFPTWVPGLPQLHAPVRTPWSEGGQCGREEDERHPVAVLRASCSRGHVHGRGGGERERRVNPDLSADTLRNRAQCHTAQVTCAAVARAPLGRGATEAHGVPASVGYSRVSRVSATPTPTTTPTVLGMRYQWPEFAAGLLGARPGASVCTRYDSWVRETS